MVAFRLSMVLSVACRHEGVNNVICKPQQTPDENLAPVMGHGCLSFFFHFTYQITLEKKCGSFHYLVCNFLQKLLVLVKNKKSIELNFFNIFYFTGQYEK